MTEYNINIVRGKYKNRGIVYVVDVRNNGQYYGAWLFDKIKEVTDFIKQCDDSKDGLPKGVKVK